MLRPGAIGMAPCANRRNPRIIGLAPHAGFRLALGRHPQVRSDAGRVSITTDAREASHSPQVLRRVECRRLALAGLWLGGPFAFQQAAHRGGAEAHGAPSVLARSRAYPFSHAAVQIGALAPPIARLQSLLYRPPAPKP